MCALTVLCGLVVVAVSRLLLQKRGLSPGGTAAEGPYHCPGKVRVFFPWNPPRSIGPHNSAGRVRCRVLSAENPGVRVPSELSDLQLYFTFPLESLLAIGRVQICDFTVMNDTFEKKKTIEITTGGLSGCTYV